MATNNLVLHSKIKKSQQQDGYTLSPSVENSNSTITGSGNRRRGNRCIKDKNVRNSLPSPCSSSTSEDEDSYGSIKIKKSSCMRKQSCGNGNSKFKFTRNKYKGADSILYSPSSSENNEFEDSDMEFYKENSGYNLRSGNTKDCNDKNNKNNDNHNNDKFKVIINKPKTELIPSSCYFRKRGYSLSFKELNSLTGKSLKPSTPVYGNSFTENNGDSMMDLDLGYNNDDIYHNSKRCCLEEDVLKFSNSLQPNCGTNFQNSFPKCATHLRHNSFDEAKKAARNKHCVPLDDINARERCFDYLVNSIDEAWAKYYDATLSAEQEMYSEGGFSDSDMEVALEEVNKPYNKKIDMTETPNEINRASKSASSLPENVHLQKIKDRLLSAKYDLQECLSDHSRHASVSFWTRWDKIKYTAIDFCEDDEEDVDGLLRDLEMGRWEGSFGY